MWLPLEHCRVKKWLSLPPHFDEIETFSWLFTGYLKSAINEFLLYERSQWHLITAARVRAAGGTVPSRPVRFGGRVAAGAAAQVAPVSHTREPPAPIPLPPCPAKARREEPSCYRPYPSLWGWKGLRSFSRKGAWLLNIPAENVGGVLKCFDKGYEHCLHI